MVETVNTSRNFSVQVILPRSPATRLKKKISGGILHIGEKGSRAKKGSERLTFARALELAREAVHYKNMTNANPTFIAPPPSAWAMELYTDAGNVSSSHYDSPTYLTSTQDAYDAWKHCKDVTREDGRYGVVSLGSAFSAAL